MSEVLEADEATAQVIDIARDMLALAGRQHATSETDEASAIARHWQAVWFACAGRAEEVL